MARQVTHSIHWTISKIGGWDSLTNLQVKRDNLDTSIKAWSTGKVMYILNIRETKKSTSLMNMFGKFDINMNKYLVKSHTVTVEVTRD